MSPTSLSPLGNYEDKWENGQDFLSRNDASSIPKIRSLEFLLDFISKDDASSITRIYIFCPEFTERVFSYFKNIERLKI